ncbi:hypothetical protein J6590_082657 [Homalodisca vitripennis]|nr:hypothetical protein J6590_082657 [Homalodisca vitripennis]
MAESVIFSTVLILPKTCLISCQITLPPYTEIIQLLFSGRGKAGSVHEMAITAAAAAPQNTQQTLNIVNGFWVPSDNNLQPLPSLSSATFIKTMPRSQSKFPLLKTI